ncbi:MAG: hypothetical protein HN353_04420 [Bdellovibrionales bacterium]|jgi:hypothetical protein|nr:hypothetical protein [Bdellovibrionales bacterium]MBT3527470.1 hypothetical protein [Bdellovibrionales bacterium]
MKRFIYFLFYLIVGVTLLGLLGWILPYLLYFKAIFGSINNDYIVIAKHSDNLISGAPYQLPAGSDSGDGAPHWWQDTHLQNFVVPLPISHPILVPIPLVINPSARKGVLLGAKIATTRGDQRLSFHSIKPFRLKIGVSEVKLWSLPLPKRFISKKNSQQIWKDLYLLNLTFGISRSSTVSDYWEMLSRVSYEDLNYNLYILYLRIRLWGKQKVNSLHLYHGVPNGSRLVGVVELESSDSSLSEYLLLSRDGMIVRGLKVIMQSDSATAADIYRLLINRYYYKASRPQYTDEIYVKYQQMPYNLRIKHPGMVDLFSCWTHQLDNEAIMQEMISFLERGEVENRKFLTPLYEYAHRRFGSSFSGKQDGNLKESAARRLERKILEEGEAEIAYERSLLDDSAQDFESDQERIKFFLQKAKQRKNDLDKSETELESY